MTDPKWTPELEAEYQEAAHNPRAWFKSDPDSIGRFMWLSGRTSGAREEREKFKMVGFVEELSLHGANLAANVTVGDPLFQRIEALNAEKK